MLAALFVACSGSSDSATGPAPGTTARSYEMGFAPTPPRPTDSAVIRTAQAVARVSEVTIIQQPVPWAELLGGTKTMEQALAEREQLASFLRALGLRIIFLLDPLDGLDRRKEDPGLVALGRSIREPEIRAMHEQWALEIARRIHPEWFGLASEVNTLADLGPPDLYAAVRAMVNELAPQIEAVSPGTRTFVSFQADEAWGLGGIPRGIDHFALADSFDVDGLGLSTYPGAVLQDPAQLPDDFFARFAAATTKPLLLVEGGWNSAPTGSLTGTPEKQAAFFRRIAALLDGVHAQAWVFLLYTDLDIPSYGLPPERAAGLSNFARMGIVDTAFTPKLSAAVWDSVRARPLAP